MKRHLFHIILSLLALCNMALPGRSPDTIPSTGQTDTVSTSYLKIFEALTHLKLDPANVAEVADFALQRDVGNFFLKKGKIYLTLPVEGKICAALFLGKGEFEFTPPTQIEKEQLYRFYQTEHFEKPFNMLFLFFADSTLSELHRHLTFTHQRIPRKATDMVDYALKYLAKSKSKFFEYAMMKTFLENTANSLFYAHFSKDKIKPFFFYINPYANEEVRFMRRLKGPSYVYAPEIINQFHTRQEYADRSFLTEEDKNDLYIRHYKIDCTLKGNRLNFSAATEIEFTPLVDRQKWLAFALYDELVVDSAFWSDGKRVTFIKEKGNPLMWVKGIYPFRKDSTYVMRMYYHGDLIERRRDWFYIKSSRGWYPSHGEYQKSLFDLTYHIPDKFDFVSVGELQSTHTDGEVTTTHWITPKPIRNASFNIGFFRKYEIETDSIPKITVLMAETGHQEIARALGRQGIGSGRNMEKEVGKDIVRSIRLFQRIFGTAPVSNVYATDIPYLHGEAFPGLVHLSWMTFQRTAEGGMDEVFRAHEVAHQWWGIGVDIKSYHDQWLSEGFAEYAGWWYFHNMLHEDKHDDKKYYRMLKQWRKKIAGNRKYFLGKGQAAAPIWLGYRTQSSDTRGDYTLIIYKKAAWVLHMLHTMLTDPKTGDDNRFRELLKQFYQTYQGKNASTEDFLHAAENFLGMDLHWFFDQWVYGSAIPVYKVAYKIEQTPAGRFRVLGKVEQSGVSEDFRMPMLIGIRLGKDEILPFRVQIQGPQTTFSLGEFERKPKKVIFNYRESVLCELKKGKW